MEVTQTGIIYLLIIAITLITAARVQINSSYKEIIFGAIVVTVLGVYDIGLNQIIEEISLTNIIVILLVSNGITALLYWQASEMRKIREMEIEEMKND